MSGLLVRQESLRFLTSIGRPVPSLAVVTTALIGLKNKR